MERWDLFKSATKEDSVGSFSQHERKSPVAAQRTHAGKSNMCYLGPLQTPPAGYNLIKSLRQQDSRVNTATHLKRKNMTIHWELI